MKRILVPTDFSKCASSAVDMANSIAKSTGAELHFLHIAAVPVDWYNMTDGEKRYPEVTKEINHCQSQLDVMVTETNASGGKAVKFLVFNQNYRGILEHVKENQIDLVVMGSKGATGLKEMLIGSNTQKIVRLSPVPVLVVKESPTGVPKIDNLVFVSDFNEVMMDQFKNFVEYARLLKTKLSLLFINTPENFTDSLTTKIQMGNYAMHAPGIIENTYVFNHFDFLRGLDIFCKENHIGAIGMITHGGGTGMHLFNASLTEKVVNHTKLPVLTMHYS